MRIQDENDKDDLAFFVREKPILENGSVGERPTLATASYALDGTSARTRHTHTRG